MCQVLSLMLWFSDEPHRLKFSDLTDQYCIHKYKHNEMNRKIYKLKTEIILEFAAANIAAIRHRWLLVHEMWLATEWTINKKYSQNSKELQWQKEYKISHL